MSPWRRAPSCCAAVALIVFSASCGREATGVPPGGILVVDRRAPTCSDRPASSTGPFCTIGAAVARVAPGQSVLVRPGTYHEEVEPPVSGTAGQPIVITADPGGPVRVTGRRHGFRLVSKSHVSIEGFVVEGTAGSGVTIMASDNVTVSGLTLDGLGEEDPALVADGIAVSASRDVVLTGNDISRSNRSGIFLDATTSAARVERNLIVSSGAGVTKAGVGIDVRGDKNLILHNVGRENDDSGIQFHEGASDNVAAGNLVVANGDHGIDVANSPRQHIVGNTVVANRSSGINVEGAASAATIIANNIATDNGTGGAPDAANIRVTAAAVPGASADHDLVRRRPPGNFYVWSSRGFRDLEDVRTTGQEGAGREGDPRFVDDIDFEIDRSSPAVAGADGQVVGHAAVDRLGRPRSAAPDIGALDASAVLPAPRLVRSVPTPAGTLVAWLPERASLGLAHEVLVDGTKVADAAAGVSSVRLPKGVLGGAVSVRAVGIRGPGASRASTAPRRTVRAQTEAHRSTDATGGRPSSVTTET